MNERSQLETPNPKGERERENEGLIIGWGGESGRQGLRLAKTKP